MATSRREPPPACDTPPISSVSRAGARRPARRSATAELCPIRNYGSFYADNFLERFGPSLEIRTTGNRVFTKSYYESKNLASSRLLIAMVAACAGNRRGVRTQRPTKVFSASSPPRFKGVNRMPLACLRVFPAIRRRSS